MPLRIAALLLGLALAVPAARAEDGIDVVYGPSIGWQMRRDFGGSTRAAFAPELWGAIYLPATARRLYWRPALRLGYVGLDQSDMPGAIAIEERDAVAAIELGAVFDGPVIPTVALGGGPVLRFIDLDTSDQVVAESDDVSGLEVLGRVYLQAGLGLPLFGGDLVVEPGVRLQQVFGDDRIRWRLAVDASLRL